jgi:hypothetical protein
MVFRTAPVACYAHATKEGSAMNRQIVHLRSDNPFRPYSGRWRLFSVLLACKTTEEFRRAASALEDLPRTLNVNRHLSLRVSEGLIRLV